MVAVKWGMWNTWILVPVLHWVNSQKPLHLSAIISSSVKWRRWLDCLWSSDIVRSHAKPHWEVQGLETSASECPAADLSQICQGFLIDSHQESCLALGFSAGQLICLLCTKMCSSVSLLGAVMRQLHGRERQKMCFCFSASLCLPSFRDPSEKGQNRNASQSKKQGPCKWQGLPQGGQD